MSSTSTKQHFDAGARDYYRQNYEQPKNRHELTLSLRRAACLAMMPPTSGNVLDLGCGPGAMAVPLVQQGHQVFTCDLSIEMAREAASRVAALDTEPASVAANAMSLPFRDASFGAVVTTGVLEYVPSLSTSLDEIRRVLVPGGTLIATMSLPRSFERFAVKVYARLRGRRQDVTQYIYGRVAFDRAIENAGFAIEDSRCGSFAPFPLDALVPQSLAWIDHTFGDLLNRSSFARDRAKTYIVRARRV